MEPAACTQVWFKVQRSLHITISDSFKPVAAVDQFHRSPFFIEEFGYELQVRFLL
jgi:hypothetical protein